MIHSNYFEFLDNVQPLTRRVTDFVCQHFLRLAGSSWKITCTLPMNWCLPLIPLLLRGLMIHHPIYPATMFAFQGLTGHDADETGSNFGVTIPLERLGTSSHLMTSRWWMKVNMLKPFETNKHIKCEDQCVTHSVRERIIFDLILSSSGSQRLINIEDCPPSNVQGKGAKVLTLLFAGSDLSFAPSRNALDSHVSLFSGWCWNA